MDKSSISLPLDLDVGDQAITPRAAAEVTGVSLRTLARWRTTSGSPNLPFIRLGARIVRYRLSDVRAFLERCGVMFDTRGKPGFHWFPLRIGDNVVVKEGVDCTMTVVDFDNCGNVTVAWRAIGGRVREKTVHHATLERA